MDPKKAEMKNLGNKISEENVESNNKNVSKELENIKKISASQESQPVIKLNFQKKIDIREVFFVKYYFIRFFRALSRRKNKEKRKNNIEEYFDIWIKEEVREGRVVNYGAK